MLRSYSDMLYSTCDSLSVSTVLKQVPPPMYTCYSSAVMVPFSWAICLQWGMSVVDVAGNMQEEFVQAVLTVHTYIHTHMYQHIIMLRKCITCSQTSG